MDVMIDDADLADIGKPFYALLSSMKPNSGTTSEV